MTLTLRGLVSCRVRLPQEVELSTCPGCPGWKAYSNQMSTRARQPLPQLQQLPLYCTLGAGGWRFQVPVCGHGGSQVNFRCSDFQAHQFEAQIEDDNIGFPDSESLGIVGPKMNFFLLRWTLRCNKTIVICKFNVQGQLNKRQKDKKKQIK